MADEPDRVEIILEDGRRIRVHPRIADLVRGVDTDGDLVVPLGTPEAPIRHPDGTEYLIPLTPCCHAMGKGAHYSSTGVVCRSCYRDVDTKCVLTELTSVFLQFRMGVC